MRAFAAHIILLFVFVSNAWPAEPARPVDRLRSLGDIAAEMASYFPKVEARVKDVSGDRLTISIGKKEGLVPGVVLSLWREGRELRHPTTGVVIGRAEEEIGSAEVTDVGDGTSSAIIKKRLKQPKEGDRARITPRRIKIGLIPEAGAHPGVISELAERLNDTGRFSVIEEAKVSAFLKARTERGAELARSASSSLGLDAAALVSMESSSGSLLVTVKLFSGETGTLIGTISSKIEAALKTSTLADVRPFFALPTDGKDEGPNIPFDAKLFVPADVNGDGVIEGVFSDGGRLHIYKEELSGWREVWSELDKGSAGNGHINIDISDINANGIPEIFVTAVNEGKVMSYVLEAGADGFRRIAEVPAFLRVVSYPGRGNILIGLDPAAAGQASIVKEYVWSSGAYIPGATFPLPEGVGLYGFVLADFGGKNIYLVARDSKDRLVVYLGTELVWKGQERYLGIDKALPSSLRSSNNKSVKTRLIAADIDGDGKDEIIIQNNIKRKVFMGFKSGEIHVLAWVDGGLVQKRVLTGLAGPVLDLAVQRNAGLHLLSLVREPAGLFTSSRTFVTYYRLDVNAH